MYNEEAVNTIIKNYTESILENSLEEKQKYLVRNGLAQIVEKCDICQKEHDPKVVCPEKAGYA